MTFSKVPRMLLTHARLDSQRMHGVTIIGMAAP